jgi:hypothetical protein
MQRSSGRSSIEGVLVDRVSVQAEDVAEEAELILRLAELRPDHEVQHHP